MMTRSKKTPDPFEGVVSALDWAERRYDRERYADLLARVIEDVEARQVALREEDTPEPKEWR